MFQIGMLEDLDADFGKRPTAMTNWLANTHYTRALVTVSRLIALVSPSCLIQSTEISRVNQSTWQTGRGWEVDSEIIETMALVRELEKPVAESGRCRPQTEATMCRRMDCKRPDLSAYHEILR